MEYFDISPLVSPEMAVYPGDQVFERKVSHSFSKGDNLELSSMLTTLHIGAHVDAPSHYVEGGVGIDERDIRLYVGKCQVIDVSGALAKKRKLGLSADLLIEVDDFKNTPIEARRVIFKTMTFEDPSVWSDDFAAFDSSTVRHLSSLGVRMMGIDTPSIDPAKSKELPSHKEVAKNDMAVLEGVLLTDVPADVYILFAAPLRLAGADASPVRALLFRIDTDLARL